MKHRLAIFEKYFIYFFMYSVFGWLYEVFLEVVIYQWGFSNRGFLFGPYTPVYGFGALLFIVFLYQIKKNRIYIGKINIAPIVIFFGAAMIATVVELITSYALELVTTEKLWDYTAYAFNFQGRIALNPSIRFGLGGIIFLYVLQPLFEKIVALLSPKKLHFTFVLLGSMMLIDLVFKLFQIIS